MTIEIIVDLNNKKQKNYTTGAFWRRGFSINYLTTPNANMDNTHFENPNFLSVVKQVDGVVIGTDTIATTLISTEIGCAHNIRTRLFESRIN